VSKCVVCRSRKGKRTCPLYDGVVCSSCCGQVRTETSDCPADCQYNFAGRVRRGLSDSFSGVRERFVSIRGPRFEDAAVLANVFFIESVVYRFYQRSSYMTDEAVAESYERASRLLGDIILPGDRTDLLAVLLAHGVESGFFMRLSYALLSEESAVEIFKTLAGIVREHVAHKETWGGYFRELENIYHDFRVPRELEGGGHDLLDSLIRSYEDEEEDEEEEPAEGPGTIILP